MKSAGRLLPILSADLPSTPVSIPNALLVLFFGDHGAGAHSPQDSGSVRANRPACWARLDHHRSVSLLRDALMCPPGMQVGWELQMRTIQHSRLFCTDTTGAS
ncbi:MAG: hypothetical protein DMG97_10735 [Acidobacteria bacterium]|nr:MAG: hypothetical protein DMG97_10735 [Acidobacteriota bacterium]PYV77559.1 MAG: hypothetical protein DMG96_10775 [Acidobacteriota bacterium]